MFTFDFHNHTNLRGEGIGTWTAVRYQHFQTLTDNRKMEVELKNINPKFVELFTQTFAFTEEEFSTTIPSLHLLMSSSEGKAVLIRS